MFRVVVFTGGRGSGVLSRRLLGHRHIDLVLAINGYDDGGSTGEVRRFLGDALGPSDYRKNASRVAEATRSCSRALAALLETRLPVGVTPDQAIAALDTLGTRPSSDVLGDAAEGITDPERAAVADRLAFFTRALDDGARSFRFADCAVGNLVFAGCYLRAGRRFNDAVDDYASLLGLPPGLIENVTDGRNAHLVAVDSTGRVLGSESDIVNAAQPASIADIFLIDRSLRPDDCASMAALGSSGAVRALEARAVPLVLNPRLAARLEDADLIIYAPGTLHSSLYPSFLTTGLPDVIAGNLRATKLLITNLERDAETAGADAVALVSRALHYLTDKGRRPRPAPSLITHYILNDPRSANGGDRAYVPLGQVETLEDPRLVRIGYFEDGVAGRHDGAKVLEPFLASRLEGHSRPRVGVLLYDATSGNKLAQTLLEISRASRDVAADLRVHARAFAELDEEFLERLPFPVTLHLTEDEAELAVRSEAEAGRIAFVGLFESSGMYRGEDFAALLQYLAGNRVDAVWGSRRLSLRDMDASYGVIYRSHPALRLVSRAGSQLLSLTYLTRYGRYIADTLSGVRIVRAADAAELPLRLIDRRANQFLLRRVLNRRADLLEVPVQFIPMASARARRITIGDGLGSLAAATIGAGARRARRSRIA